MRKPGIVGAAIALTLTAAACGGDKVSGGGSGAAGVAVAVRTFQFKPNPAQVKAGTSVTWTNYDDTTHTVTAGTPDNKDGAFDGKLAGPNSTFTFTFDKPGTYPYFCSKHTSMTAEVTVV